MDTENNGLPLPYVLHWPLPYTGLVLSTNCETTILYITQVSYDRIYPTATGRAFSIALRTLTNRTVAIFNCLLAYCMLVAWLPWLRLVWEWKWHFGAALQP